MIKDTYFSKLNFSAANSTAATPTKSTPSPSETNFSLGSGSHDPFSIPTNQTNDNSGANALEENQRGDLHHNFSSKTNGNSSDNITANRHRNLHHKGSVVSSCSISSGSSNSTTASNNNSTESQSNYVHQGGDCNSNEAKDPHQGANQLDCDQKEDSNRETWRHTNANQSFGLPGNQHPRGKK